MDFLSFLQPLFSGFGELFLNQVLGLISGLFGGPTA
jgi:hypothetical protein